MTPSTMVNLKEFLRQAADCGPCVGVHAVTPSPLIPPDGVELRTVNGANTTTIDRLFDAFAAVWHFPPRFAHNHGKDSLMIGCVTSTIQPIQIWINHRLQATSQK